MARRFAVREMVELAFAQVGRRIEWRGEGVEETGGDAKSGKTLVKIDPSYFRPTEVDLLVGDASKARKVLGWKPKRTFNPLVEEMVAGDLAEAKRDAANGKDSLRRRPLRHGRQCPVAPAGAGGGPAGDGGPARAVHVMKLSAQQYLPRVPMKICWWHSVR